MPITVECPNGHRMTLADKLAGKRHRCPLCLAYVDVPVPDPEAPPDEAAEAAEAAREREAARYRRRLERVNAGLTFHYGRIVVLLLSLLGSMWILIGRPFLPDVVLEGSVVGVSVAVLVLAPLFGLIGSVLCLKAPAEVRGRGLILWALVLDLAPFFLAYFALAGDLDAIERYLILVAGGASNLCGWACFIGFLHRLAEYLEQPYAAREAYRILIKGIFLWVLPPLLGWALVGVYFLMLEAWNSIMLSIYLPLALGVAVLDLVLFIVFILFLFQQLALISSLREVVWKRILA
jgi:hypothetical protein